jgi:hypothetical protein
MTPNSMNATIAASTPSLGVFIADAKATDEKKVAVDTEP